MPIFDIAVNATNKQLVNDLPQLVERSLAAGVDKWLVVGGDVAQSLQAVEIATSYHGGVDGVDGSDEKMFILANNVSSPLCCPSTFTTSTGCLCTTKNQRDFIAARGILEQNPSDDNPVDEVEV